MHKLSKPHYVVRELHRYWLRNEERILQLPIPEYENNEENVLPPILSEQ